MDYFDEPLFNQGSAFTSATLAQDGSCAAFARSLRLNLDTERVLSTPFPLSERTCVYVSSHVNPKSPVYREELADEIMRLIRVGEFKTFILFSSIGLMHDQYRRLGSVIGSLSSERPIHAWVQDKYNKEKILRSFANPNENSVLFGSLSFFEGVDLKGRGLTQVILTRLPYAYYGHPVQRILNRDGQYSQWEAVLRFEQAYGRIMRRLDDYGTFAILDQRFQRHRAFNRLFKEADVPIVSDIEGIARF